MTKANSSANYFIRIFPKNDAAFKACSNEDNRRFFTAGSFDYFSTNKSSIDRIEDDVESGSVSSEGESEPYLDLCFSDPLKHTSYGHLFGSNREL